MQSPHDIQTIGDDELLYCTEVLHLSEAEAYLRIAVARASREHPVLLEMLADGRLHLSAIAKLASKLTPENREGLLRRATHKSKRQVEELLAELDPQPDVAGSIRKLPERGIGTLHSSGELRLDETAAVADPLRPDPRPPSRPEPPRRCATSSSDCATSCAPPSPTATWPRSSSRP